MASASKAVVALRVTKGSNPLPSATVFPVLGSSALRNEGETPQNGRIRGDNALIRNGSRGDQLDQGLLVLASERRQANGCIEPSERSYGLKASLHRAAQKSVTAIGSCVADLEAGAVRPAACLFSHASPDQVGRARGSTSAGCDARVELMWQQFMI